jgi:hypothetical protein
VRDGPLAAVIDLDTSPAGNDIFSSTRSLLLMTDIALCAFFVFTEHQKYSRPTPSAEWFRASAPGPELQDVELNAAVA